MSQSKDIVSEVMSRKVHTLHPRDRTFDALQLMIKHNFGSVVVVERGKLAGIITERDIVRKITKSFDYLNRPLSETASKPVVTISPNTPTWQAFELMLKKNIRRLPVMSDGHVVGIVTERDLFTWVVRVAYEPNVPADVKRFLARKR